MLNIYILDNSLMLGFLQGQNSLVCGKTDEPG